MDYPKIGLKITEYDIDVSENLAPKNFPLRLGPYDPHPTSLPGQSLHPWCIFLALPVRNGLLPAELKFKENTALSTCSRVSVLLWQFTVAKDNNIFFCFYFILLIYAKWILGSFYILCLYWTIGGNNIKYNYHSDLTIIAAYYQFIFFYWPNWYLNDIWGMN